MLKASEERELARNLTNSNALNGTSTTHLLMPEIIARPSDYASVKLPTTQPRANTNSLPRPSLLSNAISGSFADPIPSAADILGKFYSIKIPGVKQKHLGLLYEAKCRDLQIKASKD